MSDPQRPFEPMMHNEIHLAWDAEVADNWGSGPGPFGQQRGVIAHIATLIPGDSRMEGYGFVSPAAAAMIDAIPPVTVVSVTSSRIARPPAMLLIRFLRLVLTKIAYQKIIGPYLAQEQHEYYEALLRREYGQARWIIVRMYVLTVTTVVKALISPIIQLLKGAG